ncbi:MAG: hypothetical protein ACP5O4_06385 [bacterium]
MNKINKFNLFYFLALVFFILFFNSCATTTPTLTPPTITTNKLLTISIYFKNTIQPTFSYTYNSQNFNYNFYCALCFRFDNDFNNLNIDRWSHIYFFENGFKRSNRVNLPSPDTSDSEEWSPIIIDLNSTISNNILSFNILIPDNIIGSPNIYNFIVIVFLRDFEYNYQISDDFGQYPIDYYASEPTPTEIKIYTSNTNINQTYVLTDQEGDINQANLPPGFPVELKDSLDITKIEYIIRQQ